MHQKEVVARGRKLGEAEKVLIMIHGRGANAEDILSLSAYLNVSEFTLLAPQATGNSWYPYSFLAPPHSNEPYLSSAINLVGGIVDEVLQAGVEKKNIYFLGFSQGACLTLEYVTRNAARYGGVIAFTGGLIGDRIYAERYSGDFASTPVFAASSDPDPHVPVERVHESVKLIKQMNADVTEKIYVNMGHTITSEEIEIVNQTILNF
jgi:phospholipase/carboxylesterase